MEPHPVAGLRLKVTPPFLESFATVAVMVTAAEPASTVEPLAEEARLTLMAWLPPLPQPHSIRRAHDTKRTNNTDTARNAGARCRTENRLLAILISLFLISRN